MKVGLGTAQFGLDYGVSNRNGRIPFEEVKAIVDLAVSRDVSIFDTAASYGDAERVLVQAGLNNNKMRVVSKTISLTNGLEAVIQRVKLSAELLGRSLDTMMIHAAEDIMHPQGGALWDFLRNIQAEGIVRRLGISFYASNSILDIVARTRPEVVQVPASLFDQRLIQNGILMKLASADVEVHVRSVFHQGLIFADVGNLPPNLQSRRPLIEKLQSRLRASGYSPVRLALSFLNAVPHIHTAIIGVTSRFELESIFDAGNELWPDIDADDFALVDPVLIDPRLW